MRSGSAEARAVMGHDEDGSGFQKETGIDIEHDIDHVIAFSEPGSLRARPARAW
jgi:hypothetical protein